MQSPIQAERPVEYIIEPMDRPPPKSRSVPHSMPSTASFQEMTRLCCSSTPSAPSRRVRAGRKNSRMAARSATMDSGRILLYAARMSLSVPKATPRMPGMTHRTTASRNTHSVQICPSVQSPICLRCSAMNSCAPLISFTSAGNMRCSSTAVMTKYTIIAMAPQVIHWKNEMCTSAMVPRKPIMMRLGGVPMGVRTPPIDAPYAVMSMRPVAYLYVFMSTSRPARENIWRMASSRPTESGTIMAAVAVFETQPEHRAVAAPMARKMRVGLEPTHLRESSQ